MSDVSVRHFSYRHPRYPTRLRMDVVFGETIVLGICETISEAGLSALVGDDLPSGVEGWATLYHQDQGYRIRCTLSFKEKESVGLTFLFTSEEERSRMRSLIERVRLRSHN